MSYGMGSETDDLPSYVVIPDTRGLPAGGSINWSNGFLPARHQGVTLRAKGVAIDDLFPSKKIARSTEAASRKLLAELALSVLIIDDAPLLSSFSSSLTTTGDDDISGDVMWLLPRRTLEPVFTLMPPDDDGASFPSGGLCV